MKDWQFGLGVWVVVALGLALACAQSHIVRIRLTGQARMFYKPKDFVLYAS